MAPFDDANADLGNVSGDDNGDDNVEDAGENGNDEDDGIDNVDGESCGDDDLCVDDLLDAIEGDDETGNGCEDHDVVVWLPDAIEEFPDDSQSLYIPDDPIEDQPPLGNEEDGKKDNTCDALVHRPVARPLLNEVNPKSLPHDPRDDFGDVVEDDEHALALVQKHVARNLFHGSSSSSGASASSSSVPPSNERASKMQALMLEMQRVQAQMDAVASMHPSYSRFMFESFISLFMSWTRI